jgi:beta-barrel assembly-enhancing protease
LKTPFYCARWLVAVLCALTALGGRPTAAADIRLPALGDSSSATISPQQEDELGRAWLMAFRRQVRVHQDPQLQHYLETLIARLAAHSELPDRNLQLVIVENPSINAFAVPGGVVGVHTGLFEQARTEHQLASVLTHELAHLSQRHFARRLDAQRRSSVVGLAGLLTGLVLAATVGGDAGMAAMTASQAAMLDESLRYSRQNEQEADRVGIDTLYRAGMDPMGAPEMFERMLAATRYTGQRPPEFLLSHPLTESRVADVRARVAKYPPRQYPDSLDYQLMRARIQLAAAERPEQAAAQFRDRMAGGALDRVAARYGLALALSAQGDHEGARRHLAELAEADPGNRLYRMALIDIERAAGNPEAAIHRATRLVDEVPDYYPARAVLAASLTDAHRYGEAEKVLEGLAADRPADPQIWFDLAEISGLAGDIPGVHLARAEYFTLIGVFDQARKHLDHARRLQAQNFRQVAMIDQRQREIEQLERQLEKLR